jgi:hypothetical protein
MSKLKKKITKETDNKPFRKTRKRNENSENSENSENVEEIQESGEKKKRKRKKKSKNYYFGQAVQDKIVEYQRAECKIEKAEIYEKHISPAFTELTKSLVSVYKFKSANEDIDHLKSDCVSNLYETIHKWKPEKGKKAFSYFNVVAKNYLTIQSRRLLKNSNRSVYLDDAERLSNNVKSEIYEKEYVDGDELLRQSIARYNKILEVIEYISDKIKDDNDIKCCFAIKKLFTEIESIEFFNKRAIFVYLREISGLNSTELSSSLSSIRKIYRKSVGHDKMFNLFDI